MSSIEGHILKTLKSHWGFNSLREPQDEVIKSILRGEDLICIMPTGAGKSLCYQLPTLLMEGMTIVVSPLIALMKDQVKGLKDKGIAAAAIYSGQSRKQQDDIMAQCLHHKLELLYLSPERLSSKRFCAMVPKLDISLLIVDEAHCISEWGHDFRPEYRDIANILDLVDELPIAAFTATATTEVIADIEENLHLDSPHKVILPPTRQNLRYHVYRSENKKRSIAKLLNHFKDGSRVIYSNTRVNTKEIQNFLQNSDIEVLAYHGGMDMIKRQETIQLWEDDKVKTISATKAFGMGIDKSNVRAVIHFEIPISLEAYIQEAGRAGRDGDDAHCILMFTESDIGKIQKKIETHFPSLTYIHEINETLRTFLHVDSDEEPHGSYDFDFDEFTSVHKLKKLKTFNALKVLHQQEIIRLSEPLLHPSRLQLHQEPIQQLLNSNRVSDLMIDFIKLLTRTYEGIFLELTVINESWISKRLNIPAEKISTAMLWLHKRKMAEYKGTGSLRTISFLDIDKDLDSESLTAQKDRYIKSINSILGYIRTEECRQVYIARHYNFDSDPCGICDNCLEKEMDDTMTIESTIIQLLKQSSFTIEDLVILVGLGKRKLVLEILDELVHEDMIYMKNGIVGLSE